MEKLAIFLDSQYQLPGGRTIGWDGIIGLVPGVGDFITNSLSFYIVLQAALIGCPPSVLLRMCLNIAVDNLLDFIPLLGIILDFLWKSNVMNIELIEKYLEEPIQTRLVSRIIIVAVLIFAFFVILGTILLTTYLLALLIKYVETIWS